MARRLLRAAAQQLANATVARALASADDAANIRAVLAKFAGHTQLHELALLVLEPAGTPSEAREKLMALADKVRAMDLAAGGGHTAAADMLLLYANTQTWFTSERDYKVRHIVRICASVCCTYAHAALLSAVLCILPSWTLTSPIQCAQYVRSMTSFRPDLFSL